MLGSFKIASLWVTLLLVGVNNFHKLKFFYIYRVEKEGKQVQLFALTDITNERLRNLKGVDAFLKMNFKT